MIPAAKRPDANHRSSPGALGRSRPSRRPHRWLALLPALVVILGVTFGNRVHPYIGSLPLLFAWVGGLVVLTSAVMAFIHWRDSVTDTAHDLQDDES